ncbi:Gti1/Pac2 family-domain-containing protein, partial [Protomyces lactucae-debilis]
MQTYVGQIRTPADATILFEACRQGVLPKIQRRLSDRERAGIKHGSVFVWDEREAGMRRWTDGKAWSASRVAGPFLMYREMDGRKGGPASKRIATGKSPPREESDDSGDGVDGYAYKPDGLVKQSFSITTTEGQRLHLVSYTLRSTNASQDLPIPSKDHSLAHVQIPKGLYPE